MKNLYFFLITCIFTTLSFGQNNKDVYISEINYTGSNPFIEIAAFGNGNGNIQLKDWTLEIFDNKGKLLTTIELQGKIREGEFLLIDDPILSNNSLGGRIALTNKKSKGEDEFLSYGSAKGSGSYEYIGSTIGENSIQRVLDPITRRPTGWTTSSPTKGAPTSEKPLSVVKDQIEDFNIYPNPVRNGKISISTKNSLNKNVIIYSILGSVVYNKTVKPNEVINVQNLSTGLYLVQVEEDEKISVRKVLIN